VPLEKMAEAELAVRQAVSPIATRICERTGTAAGMPGKTSAENAAGRVRGLSGAERQLLVQQAGQALAPFKGH